MLEEKKVNISNLSDLIPEDPVPEKMNENEEDYFRRMLRPGELIEVLEEDEDRSDDISASRASRAVSITSLPVSIHSRSDSATVLDMQISDISRAVSE
jgi:hypothetical protein